MIRSWWFWLLFICLVIWQWPFSKQIELGSGIKVAKPPIQVNLQDVPAFKHEDYWLTPLAAFSLAAKVLSREDYWWGRESDLSPVDLALGWQKMSDEAVLKHIDIRQSGRWYRWRTQHFPIPRREIETQSANMHIVPANKFVETQLKKVKAGQIIQLTGTLIRADSEDGWHWQSSLSREDTGNHACELVYVTDLQIVTTH